jgi:hypothetical protein
VPFSREKLNLYSPELINAMTQAFTAVWTTLYSHLPIDGDGADELKIALSRTIIALAAEGVRDPKELRRRALENMALRSSS